ncbi:MAG: HU family DNA-binding protein [Bdellovibrio sp.]
MNKAEFIEKISKKIQMPKNQTEAVLDAALEVIQRAVAKGEEVKLVGFGTFCGLDRKPRKGRNPRTGETVQIPGGRIPKFKPGKDFKSQIL